MDAINYKIESFEGPLDLLLHLIAQHKMELYDIRICELIDQYLAFIGAIGPNQLDPTSEFIEMAARLVHMKSVALLPRHEEVEGLEEELTGQLVEYHLCKKAAEKLRDMSEGIHFYVREPLEVVFDEAYQMSHEAVLLLEAYMNIMGRGVRVMQPGTEDFDPIVTAPIVSVSSRIVHILRGMRKGVVHRLGDLFADCRTRSESVATFLGVLELIRAHRMALDPDGNVTELARRREAGHEPETV